MNKVIDKLHPITVIIMITLCICVYPSIGYSKTNIFEIRLRPLLPKAGDELEVTVTFYRPDKAQRELSITLMVVEDSNNNGIADDEEKRTTFYIHEDEPHKYVGTFNEEITIPIGKISATQFARRYEVVVKYADNFQVDYLEVPSEIPPLYNKSVKTPMWKVPYVVARELLGWSDIFSRGPTGTASNIYIYNLDDRIILPVTVNNEQTVWHSSPTWSPDNRKITFILEQHGQRQVAWTTVPSTAQREQNTNSINIILDSVMGTSPFWMPDNRHILFVKDGHLYIANSENLTAYPLKSQIQAHKVLAVNALSGENIQVFYTAPKHINYERTLVNVGLSTYMVELNAQYEILDSNPKEIIGDYSLNFAEMLSPSFLQIVYCQNVNSGSSLFLEDLQQKNKVQLFESNFNCYDPAWSPDGKKISFVSDRF